MRAARSNLAEAGSVIEVPPDATVFRAGGTDYFLYMGATEMRALQREWGVTVSVADSAEEYRRKFELYRTRFDTFGILEDDLTVIRVGLGRWHKASGGKRALTNDSVLEILEELEPEPGEERRSTFVMIGALKVRFISDMFGLRRASEGGGDRDPNAPSGEPSTQSGS